MMMTTTTMMMMKGGTENVHSVVTFFPGWPPLPELCIISALLVFAVQTNPAMDLNWVQTWRLCMYMQTNVQLSHLNRLDLSEFWFLTSLLVTMSWAIELKLPFHVCWTVWRGQCLFCRARTVPSITSCCVMGWPPFTSVHNTTSFFCFKYICTFTTIYLCKIPYFAWYIIWSDLWTSVSALNARENAHV